MLASDEYAKYKGIEEQLEKHYLTRLGQPNTRTTRSFSERHGPQTQQDVHTSREFGNADISVMLSMMTSKKDGRLKTPGDARFRDMRRAEQKYKDVIKSQRDEIAKLTDEIARIRQLVKKFLNPEQMVAFRISAEEASSKRDCGELTVEVAEGEGAAMTDEEGSPINQELEVQLPSDVTKSLVKPESLHLSDVHQLYQDFYLSDLKQEVQDAQKIATKFRKEKNDQTFEISALKKDNNDLRCQLKRYR